MPDLLASEVVRRFVEAVIGHLRHTVGADAVLAALGEPHDADAIAVTIDFRGDVRGPVTWVFPEAIALELVRRLMADPDPAKELAVDGATELANLLAGRASEELERHGFRCEFGAPRHHIGALPDGISVRMATTDGPIDLVLAMRRTRTIPIVLASL